MNYSEAMKLVDEGNVVGRKFDDIAGEEDADRSIRFQYEDWCVYYNNIDCSYDCIFNYSDSYSPSPLPYTPNKKDRFAEDWEIVPRDEMCESVISFIPFAKRQATDKTKNTPEQMTQEYAIEFAKQGATVRRRSKPDTYYHCNPGSGRIYYYFCHKNRHGYVIRNRGEMEYSYEMSMKDQESNDWEVVPFDQIPKRPISTIATLINFLAIILDGKKCIEGDPKELSGEKMAPFIIAVLPLIFMATMIIGAAIADAGIVDAETVLTMLCYEVGAMVAFCVLLMVVAACRDFANDPP